MMFSFLLDPFGLHLFFSLVPTPSKNFIKSVFSPDKQLKREARDFHKSGFSGLAQQRAMLMRLPSKKERHLWQPSQKLLPLASCFLQITNTKFRAKCLE